MTGHAGFKVGEVAGLHEFPQHIIHVAVAADVELAAVGPAGFQQAFGLGARGRFGHFVLVDDFPIEFHAQTWGIGDGGEPVAHLDVLFGGLGGVQLETGYGRPGGMAKDGAELPRPCAGD